MMMSNFTAKIEIKKKTDEDEKSISIISLPSANEMTVGIERYIYHCYLCFCLSSFILMRGCVADKYLIYLTWHISGAAFIHDCYFTTQEL